MEKILRELKFESLFPKFPAQRIEPENVSVLSDEELSCLGVSTIGDRLRLRGLCANAGKDHPSVAVMVTPHHTMMKPRHVMVKPHHVITNDHIRKLWLAIRKPRSPCILRQPRSC